MFVTKCFIAKDKPGTTLIYLISVASWIYKNILSGDHWPFHLQFEYEIPDFPYITMIDTIALITIKVKSTYRLI